MMIGIGHGRRVGNDLTFLETAAVAVDAAGGGAADVAEGVSADARDAVVTAS